MNKKWLLNTFFLVDWITLFQFSNLKIVIYVGSDELLWFNTCGKVTVKVENASSQFVKISNDCEEDNYKSMIVMYNWKKKKTNLL